MELMKNIWLEGILGVCSMRMNRSSAWAVLRSSRSSASTCMNGIPERHRWCRSVEKLSIDSEYPLNIPCDHQVAVITWQAMELYTTKHNELISRTVRSWQDFDFCRNAIFLFLRATMRPRNRLAFLPMLSLRLQLAMRLVTGILDPSKDAREARLADAVLPEENHLVHRGLRLAACGDDGVGGVRRAAAAVLLVRGIGRAAQEVGQLVGLPSLWNRVAQVAVVHRHASPTERLQEICGL
ncbi:hypothetical protein EYF80_009218 [Liparis tanakae]|uniref:Uncharacterized protein n=1 Tax=Liparis tanakae TaxID=230148 RepID=A0A4Z2IR70_9TELE|nr:hypothetical protein EYF80_009218 [Liparis tanakae]